MPVRDSAGIKELAMSFGRNLISMARFFLSRDAMDLASGVIPIAGDDAHHIAFSLRMAVGDALTVCDMQKTEYVCTITDIKPDLVLLRIDDIRENSTELPLEITLYQSLPKGDKMDTVVQKAVELGVTSIVPVASARCIVKLDEKTAQKKIARWQKIAEEAAKQCGRGIVPQIGMPVTFAQAITAGAQLDLPLFCYEGDGTVSLKSVLDGAREKMQTGKSPNPLTSAIYIGPEGGYDTREVALAQSAGFPSVNLGRRILRCETASGFVLSCMTYAFEL